MVSLDALSDRLSLAQFKWTLVAFGFTYFAITVYFLGSVVQIALAGGLQLLLSIALTVTLMQFSSIIGCIAGSRNNPQVVVFHMLLLFACLGGQFITGGVHLNSRSSGNAEEMIKKEFTAKFEDQSAEVKDDIQRLQTALACCGLNGYQDYGKSTSKVPDSCCGKYDPSTSYLNTGQCKDVEELEKVKGCGLDALYKVYVKNFTFQFTGFTTFVVVVLFTLEFVDLFLSFLLRKRLLKDHEAERNQWNVENPTGNF